MPGCLGTDLPKQGTGLGIGFGIDLAVEEQAQVSIHLNGGGVAAGVGQQRHQGAVGRLAQRVGGDCTAQVPLGSVVVAAGDRPCRECFQGAQKGLFARLSLLEGPVLGTGREEGTAIEGDSSFQRRHVAICDGGVEGERVHRRAGQIQRERAGRRREQPIGLRPQRAPQIGQADAQAGAGFALHALRPEQRGQPVAFDLPTGVQRQQSQQPASLARPQVWQAPAIQADLQRAEQANDESGRNRMERISDLGLCPGRHLGDPFHRLLRSSSRSVYDPVTPRSYNPGEGQQPERPRHEDVSHLDLWREP